MDELPKLAQHLSSPVECDMETEGINVRNHTKQPSCCW